MKNFFRKIFGFNNEKSQKTQINDKNSTKKCPFDKKELSLDDIIEIEELYED